MHSHKVKMLKLSYLERFDDEWFHNQIKSMSTWQYYGWPSLYMNKNCLNCQQFDAADYINYEGWLCLMTIEHFMAKFNKRSFVFRQKYYLDLGSVVFGMFSVHIQSVLIGMEDLLSIILKYFISCKIKREPTTRASHTVWVCRVAS